MMGRWHPAHDSQHPARGRRAAVPAPSCCSHPVPCAWTRGRGGDPMEPCWDQGWCHPHPTDQPQPAPDPLWGSTTGLLARQMDRPRWGSCHRQPRAKRHTTACRRSAWAQQQRVSPAGGTASSAPGAWHSLIILSLARSANAFPASRLLSLGCVRSAGAL